MAGEEDKSFQFAISLSVLNHLGRNLYRNFITVLGEAISNSWDADAENVYIYIDRDQEMFWISDDGSGMSALDFQDKFLKIGYSKRKEGGSESGLGRPYIGAKGIGKLALLSCAERVSIFSKLKGEEFVSGTIDNSGLDAAIHNDLIPEDYPLEEADYTLIEDFKEFEQGTILVFEGAKEILRHSEEQVRKLLAMSFRFSLIDERFTIFVNDEEVSAEDLSALAEATEFIWNINEFTDEFLKLCINIKSDPIQIEANLPILGYLATVELPRHLKIRGTEDQRATVDLFVNGRLRERNIIRHIPTQRIVESYLYGEIHFDKMDGDGSSPFTSSREGIVEDDENFVALLDYIKRELLNKVIDQWDDLRLARGEDGDEENPRVSRKQRKAAGLVAAAEDEFRGEGEDESIGLVDTWISELRPDAEFNVSSYVDCFLAENLVRKYIVFKNPKMEAGVAKEIVDLRDREKKRKREANISFDIRKNDSDLSYLGMDALALTAEGSKNTSKQSLWGDAINFRPVRNAVGHTGLLTSTAKAHLNVTFENMRGRVKALLADVAEEEEE